MCVWACADESLGSSAIKLKYAMKKDLLYDSKLTKRMGTRTEDTGRLQA